MTKSVDVETVRGWLADDREIAFLDVREEGQHGSGHPMLGVNLPYSRLETEISRLVPYLQWEMELPVQIAADGLSGFRIAVS